MSTFPSEKNFHLSKVKLDPKQGLVVNYQITTNEGSEPCVIDRTEVSSREVHPDLKGLFDDLRSVVGRVLGISSFLSLIESDGFGLRKAKQEEAREFAEELLQKIEVRGVAWSGTGEGEGVVITSVFETPNGQKTCINTPRLKLSQISYGFEEELEAIVEQIGHEVYAYLFEGKQAQLSLFGQSPDEIYEQEKAMM